MLQIIGFLFDAIEFVMGVCEVAEIAEKGYHAIERRLERREHRRRPLDAMTPDRIVRDPMVRQ